MYYTSVQKSIKYMYTFLRILRSIRCILAIFLLYGRCTLGVARLTSSVPQADDATADGKDSMHLRLPLKFAVIQVQHKAKVISIVPIAVDRGTRVRKVAPAKQEVTGCA